MKSNTVLSVVWTLLGAGFAFYSDNIVAALLCFIICHLIRIEDKLEQNKSKP